MGEMKKIAGLALVMMILIGFGRMLLPPGIPAICVLMCSSLVGLEVGEMADDISRFAIEAAETM